MGERLQFGIVRRYASYAAVQRFLPLLLFACGFLLCAPSIWSETSITGQDEYWLSLRTPLEMLERGEWWTPFLDGEPRLRKPPLLYWLMATSYEVLGVDLFAARIWSVLAAAGLAVIGYRLQTLLLGRGGALAALLILGTIGVGIEGRRAMLDLPLAFFTGLTVLWTARWAQGGRLGWLLAAAAALAGGFLTKGPVPIWFAVAAGLAALAAGLRRAAPLAPLWHVGAAVLLLLALALPWPIAMAVQWPQFFATMEEQARHRELGLAQLAKAPKVIGGMVGLVFPWTLVALAALWAALRGQLGDEARRLRWLALWCVIAVVPFLFLKAFERYHLPLVLPMCMLAATYLERTRASTRRWQMATAAVLLGVLGLPFCLFALWFGVAIVTPLVALGLSVWAFFAARAGAAPLGVAARLAVALAALMGGVYPTLGINALPADLPPDLSTRTVATFQRTQPGMLSIRRQRSVIEVRGEPEVMAAQLRQLDGYLFVHEADRAAAEAVAAAAGVTLQPRGRFGSFFSRKVWVRFAREDAAWADWREAFVTRRLDGLQPKFIYYEIAP
ncbi:MAG: glycosyltransferase family 39 protein [Planctomycetota bacterium]